MPRKKLDTIDREEFERRLEANNERLRLELIEAEERLRKHEIIVARKEAILKQLGQTLTEIEREENEIALLEKELPPLRRTIRKHPNLSATIK